MQTELSKYTAIIGVDWADKKHDVCVHVTATGKRELSQIPHQSEKIDEWARSPYRQYGGPMAVAPELSKGPIVAALQKYDFFVLYPINRRAWRRIARPSRRVVPRMTRQTLRTSWIFCCVTRTSSMRCSHRASRCGH